MKSWLVAIFFAFAAASGGAALGQAKEVAFDDASITAGVRQAIERDAQLRGMDIRVVTEGKVVQLRGFVDTLGDIGRAGVLAQGVAGVLQVRNALRITNRPSRT